MRLSPEACKRTLVRSNGLWRYREIRSAAITRASGDEGTTYCVMDAAIVAATPFHYEPCVKTSPKKSERIYAPPSQNGYGCFFFIGKGETLAPAGRGGAAS